jgi:hypothetical protein
MRRLLAALILVCASASAQDFVINNPNPFTVLFTNLGTPTNGNWTFCSDCAATAPCTGGGTGAFAYRVAAAWNCNTGSPAAAGNFVALDGSTVGAAAQAQAFTNGITTTATTGKVGIGMAALAGMLDITAPANLIAIEAVGTQPAAVSVASGTNAASILNIGGPPGGDTSGASANRNGGTGSTIIMNTGVGGQQTGASSGTARGGNGGFFNLILGTGGAATAVTGTVKGGAGGAWIVTGGNGGTSATSTGGAGSAFNFTGGVGGISTAAAASGKGGSFVFTAGNGGDNANAAGTAGAGGDVTIAPGAAGNASGGASASTPGVLTLGVVGATTHIVGTINGQCTLNGGATATCTATVPSTCTAPVCTYNSSSTPHTIACSVTSTTLTAVSATTLDAGVVNYWCP